jgi:hypothetical protein
MLAGAMYFRKIRKFIIIILLAALPGACSLPGSTPAPQPYEIVLFVGPQLVDCVGMGPQTCYLTRESPDEEWTYFYDPIQGFEYETGFEYQLRLKVVPLLDPPADGSAFEYELLEVIQKTPAP